MWFSSRSDANTETRIYIYTHTYIYIYIHIIIIYIYTCVCLYVHGTYISFWESNCSSVSPWKSIGWGRRTVKCLENVARNIKNRSKSLPLALVCVTVARRCPVSFATGWRPAFGPFTGGPNQMKCFAKIGLRTGNTCKWENVSGFASKFWPGGLAGKITTELQFSAVLFLSSRADAFEWQHLCLASWLAN